MKTYLKIIALLCFICLMLTASAQCPEGDVILISQEEVNEFGTLYPDCTEFGASLRIGTGWQENPTNIDDLSPLGNITYIYGHLLIGRGDSTMTLAGFSNLDSIGGNLVIERDALLTDFVGLENLQSVGNDFIVDVSSISSFAGLTSLNSIGGNFNIWVHAITDFTGLENLNTIGGWLSIPDELSSFQGLNNLTSIGGDVYTGEEYNFDDFSGLENLTTIGGGLFIQGEDAGLESFAGLENLTTIGGDFNMYECNDLYDFSALENLNTIGGNLELRSIFNDIDVVNFPNLSTIGGGISIWGCGFGSLGGLENLTEFGNSSASPNSDFIPGEINLRTNNTLTDITAISHLSIDALTIIGNPNLSLCGIESICEYLDQGGTATIYNNTGGCDSVEDILQVCTAQCAPEDVILLSQEDVNEYTALYPNCTEIYGDLIIGTEGADAPTDIIDLSPFNDITNIAGDLVIGKNDASMTLEGLSNLNSIETNLIVRRQSTLTGFTGLENLSIIDSSLIVEPETNLVNGFIGLDDLSTIGGNLSVTEHNFSFTGLERLDQIYGDFYLNGCTSTNFQGLNNLAIIHGDFILDEDNTFDDFAGLEELGYIGGSFYLQDDNSIPILSGLSKLTVVANDLLISNINNTDLTDLESLSDVGDGIKIQFCNALTSLAGLENTSTSAIHLNHNQILADINAISHMTLNELVIQGNDNLSVCHIESVCNHIAQIGGTTTIEDNTEGCNTVEEVWETCGFECPSTDVTLLSQADVNEFGVLYPDCTELEVNLQIGNTGWNDPITDIIDLSPLNNIAIIGGNLAIGKIDSSATLAGLSGLNSIGGNLDFSEAPVQGLTGLNNLNTVGGNFEIWNPGSLVGLESLTSIGGNLRADQLENFQGLNNLTSIGGDLDSNVESFEGLDNLTSIGGELFISENHNANNFVGLESLTSIGATLEIDENCGITSFAGLENLSYIGGVLDIDSECDGITSYSGLENLTTIEGGIAIRGVAANDFTGLENLSTVGGNIYISASDMSSLDGLESITNFGGTVQLTYNDSLTDISAISNLLINGLRLENNENLSVCGIPNICEYLAQGGAATIENNAEGCNTIEEIIQSCAPFLEYTIQGNVFADTNANCLQDADETGLDNWLIRIEQDNQPPRYAYTFGGGNYIALADSGAQYTLTAIPPNMLWDDICPASESVSISADNPNGEVDFGTSGNVSCPLLEVDVASPIVRRCFDSNYYISYCNSGTAVAENAYVEVQLDPFFTYQNSTIEGTDLGENLYLFDVENVGINECGNFRIDVYVDCDSTVLGQTHCVEAHIFPDSICTPAAPIWDGASIKVDAQCLGDSIEFRIENIGMGDMSDSLEYIVVEEDLIYQRANFQINSGNSKTFYKTANGEFHRLEAEQSPGHPGNSMPSVFVEGCGENDNGEISLGFVNYYLLDEGDAFVSIDCQENVGSYDPNDKQAFPVGYGAPHFITDSTDLEYLIRFQNTGTDTAFNIVIRDAISPHLNIETLRPGAASHPYRYDIEPGNIAVFHFENIMLPDSNVNEAASHGFIKFNIEQKENNPIGTHIMNDAAIYFDFNEPIITNTVFHTIGEDFMGVVTSVITSSEAIESGVSVNVFPNPFDEYTQFEIKGEVPKELHLSVYDMMGREVFQQKAQRQQNITLYKNKLTPGIYVFRLMDEKQQLATGKLIIK